MRFRARDLGGALLLLIPFAESAPFAAAAEPPAPEDPALPPAASEAEPAPSVDLHTELAARDHELAALRSELARVKAKAAEANAGVSPPPAAAPAVPPPASHAAAASPPAIPDSAGGDPQAQPLLIARGLGRPLPAWQVELVTAVGMLALGFGLGWRTLDRRIRRKYGGLKIY